MDDGVSGESDLWWLRISGVSDPEGEIAADFRETESSLGYVPNVMLALANATDPFLATRALYRSVMTGPTSLLTRIERELMALVVSVENRCDLCVIGHSSALRALTGDPYNVGIIEVNFRRARLGVRERALAEFAIKVTRAPAEIEPTCLDMLRRVGLSDREILEAAHVAAYYNMSNRLVSTLGIRSQAQAWFAHRDPPSAAQVPD